MKTAPITIRCAHCGKAAKMHSYRLRNGTGKYCGQECYLAARWGSKTGKCDHCDKPTKTRFCTVRCQKLYWNRHGHKAYALRRYWKQKLELISQLGGKCVRCGIDDIRVLDINHIDRSKKKIPKNHHYSWPRRLADWKANEGNLEILCANCHRIHTWKQMNRGEILGLNSDP